MIDVDWICLFIKFPFIIHHSELMKPLRWVKSILDQILSPVMYKFHKFSICDFSYCTVQLYYTKILKQLHIYYTYISLCIIYLQFAEKKKTESKRV